MRSEAPLSLTDELVSETSTGPRTRVQRELNAQRAAQGLPPLRESPYQLRPERETWYERRTYRSANRTTYARERMHARWGGQYSSTGWVTV